MIKNNKKNDKETSILESQIKELKQANLKYEKDLKDITNTLNEEIKKNIKKENEYLTKIKENEKYIKNLEKELNNEIQKNNDLAMENQNFKISENEYKNKIEEYEKKLISQKNVNEFILKLKNINENNKKLIVDLKVKIKQKDKDLIRITKDIMFVNFISTDQNIDCFIPCMSSDTFAELEDKLYKKYPGYRDSNNIFLYEGNSILRFKTLAENKIESGSKILLSNI